MGLLSALIKAIISAIVVVLKAFWGVKEPVTDEVNHPEPHIEVDNEKTTFEKLSDLGLSDSNGDPNNRV